jgi:8-oxo-dGTP pyrophosphatase MutT (NUDIX family)
VICAKRLDVSTNFRAAGCFCIVGSTLLVMQRQRHKAFGLHWAIPTGKIEAYESPRECITRELWEEIGLRVDVRRLQDLSSWLVEHDGQQFEYFAFVLHLDEIPRLRLNAEEVRKVEWVPLWGIKKRRVVPYFYNTVRDLLDWKQFKAIQPAMLPKPEAKSAGRRRAGRRGAVRLSAAAGC